jgi:sugar phosphate permease
MNPSFPVHKQRAPLCRWVLFAAASILFGLSMFYRATIAVVAPDLTRELSLDAGDLSLISAAFFYAYALAQIPIGIMLDRAGPARVMPPLYLLAALGVVLFAWAESPGLMTLGRFLIGAGLACGFVGALKLLSLSFDPGRFATLTAVIISVGNIGTMAATTPLVLAAGEWGWRATFLAIALFHVGIVLIFTLAIRSRRLLLRREQVAPELRPGSFAGFRRVLGQRDFWLISIVAFFRYGIFAAVQSLWAGPYLMDVLGFSPLAAGNLLLLLSVGLIVGAPVSGYLSDSVLHTRKGIMVGALLGMAVCLGALAWLPPGAGYPAFGVLFLAFGVLGSTGSVMYTHLKELVPPELSATSLTAMNIFPILGGGVVMQGLALLMQTLDPGGTLHREAFTAVFALCAAGMFLTAILYAFTRESFGRES